VQTQSSALIKSGNVISTNPPAGSQLPPASPVTVFLSSGPQRVQTPQLLGKTQAQAAEALAAVGLKLGSISQQLSGDAPAGSVLSQSPASGESTISGQSVDIVIAKSPAKKPVPDVIGQTETQAAGALGRAGFNPTSISRLTKDQSKVGVVLQQSPPAGRRLAPGGTVTIAVGTLSPHEPTQTATTQTSPPPQSPAIPPSPSAGTPANP
jgi:eukaryotic-like serine/threonine-protein kinase